MDERLPVFFFGENDMAVVNGVRTRFIETGHGELAVEVIDAFEVGEEVGEKLHDFLAVFQVGEQGAADIGGHVPVSGEERALCRDVFFVGEVGESIDQFFQGLFFNQVCMMVPCLWINKQIGIF